MYQIDPATYQVAYNSAKGDLAQAQANAGIAWVTVNRYKKLLSTSYISRQDYDQAVTTLTQNDAAVQATLETTRINLAYTRVTSPINGYIGKSRLYRRRLGHQRVNDRDGDRSAVGPDVCRCYLEQLLHASASRAGKRHVETA